MTLRRWTALAVIGVAAVAAACTPTVRRHGYAPEKEALTDIVVATDTRETVLSRFGNPSTSGVFETDTWYYVTDVRERLGALEPRSAARSITAVSFDEAGLVAAVEQYDIEDGRVVNLVSRETPTRGRELTILEQLLGNVGRLPSETLGQENLPGGAGGPRRN